MGPPPGARGGAPPGWRGGPPGPPGWRGGGEGRRDEEEGWDDQRFNGYWLGNRWYYGPPPGDAFDEPTYRPGFAPWRRGAFLPPAFQSQVVDEYWRFHLRRPPYGYHWVSVGEEFLLVSVTTGLIFDIVPGE
jgi:Ni/Co efflux regulator RcnB